MAHEQSFLLLSPPGVGKSEMVFQAAAEAGLPCRSLLGTQIAPEDVSGVPRIVGERSVFCPPRLLLPERPEPFCLFLDELPACAPDVQKAFYSLLLERRLGEHALPDGHLGGRRRQPPAGPRAGARHEFGSGQSRDHPATCASMPTNGRIGRAARRARGNPKLPHLHAGRADARSAARSGAVFDAARLGAAVAVRSTWRKRPASSVARPGARSPSAAFRRRMPRFSARLQRKRSARWPRLKATSKNPRRCRRARPRAGSSQLHPPERAGRTLHRFKPRAVNRFLRSLPPESQLTLLTDLVEQWGTLGADKAMLDLLKTVTKQ